MLYLTTILLLLIINHDYLTYLDMIRPQESKYDRVIYFIIVARKEITILTEIFSLLE